MKINNKRLIEKKLITEADDEEVVVIDPKDSVQNIEKNINGTVADSAAAASDIKDIAATINADGSEVLVAEEESIGVENRLTKILDLALKQACWFKSKKSKERANVLICGLPGSGKTAIVYDWAARAKTPKGEPVHIEYLNMKNNDLEAYINGYPIHRNVEKPEDDPDWDPRYDAIQIGQAYTTSLNGLDLPNSILFLDEYNRQVNDSIRASVLTLINEGYVSGKGKKRANGTRDSRRFFPNLLFTIAVMNPHLATDLGAAELNDAEKSRFLHKIKKSDSDPRITKDYLKKKKTKEIMQQLAQGSDADLKQIEASLREYDLGTTIIDDPEFCYDGRQPGNIPLDDDSLQLLLKQLQKGDYKMFNQRSLTAALEGAFGRADNLKVWLGEDEWDGSADFRPEVIAMLNGILDDFEDDTFENLIQQIGINELGITELATLLNKPEPEAQVASEPEAQAPAAATSTDVTDDDYEDDADIFANSAANQQSNKVVSATAAKNRIKTKMASW